MPPPPLPHQLDALQRVLDRVNIAVSDGGLPPLVVFALDDVLFDTRPRTLQILLEYAEDVEAEYPDVAQALRTLEEHRIHLLLSDTLRECGVTQADFVRDITSFWRERYHADDYVVVDVPSAGAVEYVCRLYDAGAEVCYLSTRDVPGMLLGTMAALRDHGFPVARSGVQLAMKQDATLGDEAYRRATLPDLARSGDVMAYFDGDALGCELARALFPDCDVALVDIFQHDELPALEAGVLLLRDFRQA